MQSIGQEQLAALNSATKYPSIPTHHELAPNGTLLDTGQRPEGIVLRTTDRSIITKARYQSYDRTKLLAGGTQ